MEDLRYSYYQQDYMALDKDTVLETIEYFFTKAPLESRDVFKQTEAKLFEFTKSDESWEILFQALGQKLTSIQEQFIASTIK
jgi:hypothetical protein